MDGYPAIGDHALIGDCRSAALVSRDGSVDWCCFGRFDARPVFAAILDEAKGGSFRIAPAGPCRIERRYLAGTNVLETTYQAERGRIVVVDVIPMDDAPDSNSRLLRVARCEEGEVELEVDFAPRFDYGTTIPRLEMADEHLGSVFGGADALTFQSEVAVRRTDLWSCTGSRVLQAGESARFVVSHAEPHRLGSEPLDPSRIDRTLEETVRRWQEWSDVCTYEGPYRDAVVRSALVVKALTFTPTGAVVAAPTTSLPETVGGVRNWDYRYSWLRDAALNLYALFRLGYTDEAHDFMGWIKRTTAGHVGEIQPVYGIGGEHLIFEQELPELEGYRGSHPVRIGNAAASQFQLDVYGQLLDTAWLYHRHGGDIDPVFWDLLCGVVEVLEQRWEEPDQGIWEVRDAPQQFVSSKIMVWVAVDRAIKLSRDLDRTDHVPGWERLRDRIRRRIEADGVDPETGALVRAFGSRDADASTLLAPLVGFLKAEDPRVRATARFVEEQLCVDGIVHRYRCEDGLPGDEGGFLITSFWLVDVLALLGEVDRAEQMFERLCGLANDVGLLAEQYDPAADEQLGNFPQAFSHVGLIGAAVNLEKARGKRRGRAPASGGAP